MRDNNIKFAVLGGDLRQLAVSRRLAGLGFETAVWGIDVGADEIGDAVRCDVWEDAVKGSKVWILPLPASADGVYINCPMCRSEEPQKLRMSALLDACDEQTLLMGGRFTPLFKSKADEKNIKLIDYFNSEELQIKNAIPTAEGAIAIAMNELPITLHSSRVAVIGYGRVGKTLADMLVSLGAEVTVAARKSTDLAWADTRKCAQLRIQVKNGQSSLIELGRGYDVIFNTVPCWILDENVLKNFNKNTLIIDLASAPGGVNTKVASELGLKVIWALSLPGKCSPFTAGNIICDSILETLIRLEVI